MKQVTTKISFEGAMDLIKKSKYPLAPLYEAITNALEAISQRTYSKDEQRRIELTFYFTGLLSEVKELEKIEIRDNGAGFNEESYERFETLLDKTKGFNNRGSGRIQFLHRANEVGVTSFYLANDGKRHKRVFSRSNQDPMPTA